MPSPCDVGPMKVLRPATPNATSAFPPTGHGDLRDGREGNKRDRFGVAGLSRVGRSHGTGQPLKALIVFFLVVLPCCTAAGVGWKWSALGASCTATCPVGQPCVEGELVKVNKQENFDAVKGPGVVCNSYHSYSQDWAPGRYDWSSGNTDCYPQSGTGGTCDATPSSGSRRVCPCPCAPNTFAPNLQPYPCSR